MDFSMNRFTSTKHQFSNVNDQEHLLQATKSGTEIPEMNINYRDERHSSKNRNLSTTSPNKNCFDNFDPSITQANICETESDVSENGLKDNLEENVYDIQIANGNHSNFSEVLGKLGEDAKMVILQYSQAFSASEVYEQQSIQAVIELADHATVLEQHLKLQKELICNRLQLITQNLKLEA